MREFLDYVRGRKGGFLCMSCLVAVMSSVDLYEFFYHFDFANISFIIE